MVGSAYRHGVDGSCMTMVIRSAQRKTHTPPQPPQPGQKLYDHGYTECATQVTLPFRRPTPAG